MPMKIRRIDLSPDEWIAGTLGMSVEEEGLYFRIIVRMYSRGDALPADPVELAKICGVRPQLMRRILPKLLPKFLETAGKLRQNRVETELKLARNRLETARFNGVKGGRPNDLAEPGGYVNGKPNHHYHLIRSKDLMAGGLSPPSPGDDANPRPQPSEAKPEAPADPTLKADALAMFDQCLAAIRSKTEPFVDTAE
jgi:hypothetical protein